MGADLLSDFEELDALLAPYGLSAGTVALCHWLEELDWDFKRAAAERGTSARALYRQWLAALNWNHSLAARVYRKAGTGERGVTRQAIDAQMRSLGVVRPLDLEKQLEAQDLDGAVDALGAVNRSIADKASAERLCCEQLLALAHSYRRLGEVAKARTTLMEVVKLARRMDTPELAARAMRALPYLLFQATPYGSYDAELVDALESWAPRLREQDDHEALALCLARLGFDLYGSARVGARERGIELTAEAHELASRHASPVTRSIIAGYRIVTLSGPESLDERLEILSPMVADTTTDASPDDRYFALDMLLTDLLEAGRVDEALVARRELRELEDVCSAPWPARYRVTLAILEGEWTEATRLSALPPDVPIESAAQIRGLQQFEALKQQGEWESLLGLLRFAASQQPEFIGYRFCLAQIACLMGRTDGLEADLDEWSRDDFACVPTDFLRVPNLCLLADVAHQLDRADHAEALHALLIPFVDRVAVVRVTAAILGAVARYVALLEMTLERFDEAEAHFVQAEALNEALGARPYLALTQYDHARMLASSGRDPRRASSLARVASGSAAALGMGWLVERTRSIIQSTT